MEERKYTPEEIEALQAAIILRRYCMAGKCSGCIFDNASNSCFECVVDDCPVNWKLPSIPEPPQEQPAEPCQDVKEIKPDAVNHPAHYTAGGVECIDAIEAATVNLTGIEAVCTGNVIKYSWRWKLKNGVEDLKKAAWYLIKLIKRLDPNWRAE